jgi:hypothetical protein
MLKERKKMMIKKWFKLQRKYIAIVQFIIEGYEGMATVTTMDPREAIIQISVMPDYIQEILNIVEDLKYKYNIEEITDYSITKKEDL